MSIGMQKAILDFLSTATISRLLLLGTETQVRDILESLKPGEREQVALRLAEDGHDEAAKVMLSDKVVSLDV